MEKETVPIQVKLNLTVKEASSLSGIGESTLRKLIRSQSINPLLLYVGNKALFKRKLFEEWLNKQFVIQ